MFNRETNADFLAFKWLYQKQFDSTVFVGDSKLAWRFVSTIYEELDPTGTTMAAQNRKAWAQFTINAGPCDHDARFLPYPKLHSYFLDHLKPKRRRQERRTAP